MLNTVQHSSKNKKEALVCHNPRNLIDFLGYSDSKVQHHARECLVSIGDAAVGDLIKAMKNKDDKIRWQATKALVKIGNPRAAEVFAQALHDKNYSVRWLAAEGLIRLETDGIKPLLKELSTHSNIVWVRQGARHVVNTLIKKKGFRELIPLLEIIDGSQPQLKVPIEANKLLKMLNEL